MNMVVKISIDSVMLVRKKGFFRMCVCVVMLLLGVLCMCGIIVVISIVTSSDSSVSRLKVVC